MSINGVECPNEDCGSMNTPVKFSEHTVDGTRVRQRWCAECGTRFSTGEVVLKGHSFHSLTYKRSGKPKWDGPFQKEVDPDTIEVRYLATGIIEVEVKQGVRRGRQMCRRNLHQLPPLDGRGRRQCYACATMKRRGLLKPYKAGDGDGLKAIDTTVTNVVW